MTDPGAYYRTAGDITDRTLRGVAVVLERWDARLVLLGGSLGYIVIYSLATGALALTGEGGFSLVVVETPFRRMVQPVGYLSFEPIARLETGGLTYLFSPIDTVIAVVLAVLVGANLALTYLGIRQPQACGLHSSSGVLAAIPALFSGAACCGPVVLAVIGVQATSMIITGFQLLVPIALVLLIASLILVGQRVDPELL